MRTLTLQNRHFNARCVTLADEHGMPVARVQRKRDAPHPRPADTRDHSPTPGGPDALWRDGDVWVATFDRECLSLAEVVRAVSLLNDADDGPPSGLLLDADEVAALAQHLRAE